jgi:hypothetical protein
MHSKELNSILLKAYIQNNDISKALNIIKTMPENFKKYKYRVIVYEKKYFISKNKNVIKKIKNSLKKALKIAKTDKEFEFIYKKALEFDMPEIEFNALKHIQKKYYPQYLNLALFFKKYQTAKQGYFNLYKQTHNKKYLIKTLQTALWTKDYKMMQKILNINTNLDEKEKNIFLQASITLKNKKLIKKFLSKKAPLNLQIQAYLVLKKYKQVYKLAKKENNLTLMAKSALWMKNYKTAQKLFKKLYKNNKSYTKTLYSLAIVNHNYNLIEKTLKEEIKLGKLSKINELTTIFTNNFHLNKGAEFFKKMYKKFHDKRLLTAAFTLYETEGDTENMLKTAEMLGKDITPYIALKTSRIYLGKRQINKSYKLLTTALKKNPDNITLLKNLYDIETYLNKNPKKTLQKIVSLQPSQYYVVKLSDIYLSKNEYEKAWDLLNKYDYKTPFYILTKLYTAYTMQKYSFVLNYAKNAPDFIKKENYFWYLYINSAKAKNLPLKHIYKESFKYTDFFKKDFYWYLINNKDRDITDYLYKIKNKKILYSAYLVLGNYKKAYYILKQKNSSNLKFLIKYYYLLDKIDPYEEKIKFLIYKKITSNFSYKEKLPEDIFEIYFSLSLKYASIRKINNLLKYAEKNYPDHIKFQTLYNINMGNYEKLEYMEKK